MPAGPQCRSSRLSFLVTEDGLERATYLKNAAELMRERNDELARTTVLESGKPLLEAKGEWGVAADLFEWFAEEDKRAYGRRVTKHYRGVIKTGIEDLDLPNPVIRTHYGNGFIKQYVRDHLLQRTELATNNVTDYGVKKAVENLPQLQKKMATINDNYLDVQQDILETFVDRGQLRKLAEPTVLQVWSTDITYIRMAGGFVYLVAVMDWYSRFVLSWSVPVTREVDFCIEALKRALRRGGRRSSTPTKARSSPH